MFFSPSPTPCGGSDLLLGETYTFLSHFNDFVPDYETFCFDIEEKSSDSTTSHSNHSLPEYESFCFDDDHIEEKSSGSTTSQSDHSLSEYEAFCFDIDHIEEKSSASTTAHSDLSLLEYESFHFDLSINPYPPVIRIELTRLFKENIFETSPKDLTCHELNDLRLLLSDCNSIFSKIEFPEIDLLVLFPSENEDKVFDPGILIIDEVFLEVIRFDPFLSLTQSVSMTRVMETSSSGFHHMPSPLPAT
ncbi:hypothetical protein Tco_0043190, partial [Tanacetum coccineum]